MVDRVRAAYDKMIAAEHGASSAAHESKASLALLGEEIGVHIPRHIRGFIASMPGVGQALNAAFTSVAVVAVIGVLYEAVKKTIEFREELEKMREAPERMAAEFARLNDQQKTANDELRVTNDRLENAIAKLEHRPQNALKQAIDEAADAADKLAEKMDKSINAFAESVIKNAPGTFASIIGGQAGIDDIVKLIQGKSGFGGMLGEVYKVTSAGGNPTEVLGKYRREVQAMLRQSMFAEAYQQGRGFEGMTWEQIHGTMSGRGRLPAGLHMEGMLADQAPRIETLRALEREIDLLTQSYNLEKEHAALTGKKDQLEVLEKSRSVTESLRQEVARAEEGELTGIEKINAAHRERLRHLAEEGQLSKGNIKLSEEIRYTEIKKFQRDERLKTQASAFGAGNALSAAQIRSGQAIFQAESRAAGGTFGIPEIDAEYNASMALAMNQWDVAVQHVKDLRDAKATQGEIERAQIEAAKTFALASLEAQTKRRIQLIDLAKQQRDEEAKTAKADFDNTRRVQDAVASERDRRDRDGLQRRIKMAELMGGKTYAGQLATAATTEELRIAAAQMEHDQTVRRIGQQTWQAWMLPQNTPEERRQRAAELTNLQIEGIKAEGELRRQIDDAHQDRVLKAVEIERREFEETGETGTGGLPTG